MTEKNDGLDLLLAEIEGRCPARKRPGLRDRVLGRRRYRRRTGWVMSLNLTPMIDTVFNLLFFFMIVSRFGAIEGTLPARLPARGGQPAAAAAEIPRTPIRIRLQPAGANGAGCRATIDHFRETPLEVRSLASALEQIRTNEAGFDSQTPVYLLAGDSVAWDHVVNAYNAAMSAQYERIFFAGAK